jgi:hypothetical protein
MTSHILKPGIRPSDLIRDYVAEALESVLTENPRISKRPLFKSRLKRVMLNTAVVGDVRYLLTRTS